MGYASIGLTDDNLSWWSCCLFVPDVLNKMELTIAAVSAVCLVLGARTLVAWIIPRCAESATSQPIGPGLFGAVDAGAGSVGAGDAGPGQLVQV